MNNPIYNFDSENKFLTAFRGRFIGILGWQQLDALWETVLKHADRGWYVYQVGDPPPEAPLNIEQLHSVVDGLNTMLHREHDYDYCGIVYTDHLDEPNFIKIFDPHQLGSSCGFSGTIVLPGWILSTLPPTDLPAALPPPNNRRRWWQKLFNQA